MTPKSIWIILIRILGIYFIFQAIILMPQSLAMFSTARYGSFDGTSVFSAAMILIIVFCLQLLFIRYCIFKPNWLITKLKLDEDFDEEVIALNVNRLNIINTAIIIIGGVLIADSFPFFCKSLFGYFSQINSYSGFTKYPDAAWVVYHAIKSIIAYFMIAFSKNIAIFIVTRYKQDDENATPNNNA